MRLNPITFIEWFSVICGIFLFILVPGNAFSKWLKIEAQSFLEKTVFSIVLGYLSLHILAYCLFFSGSDLPWYIFAAGCLAYTLWILYNFYLTKSWRHISGFYKNHFYKPRFPYYIIYSLLVIFILFYFDYYQQHGYFVTVDSVNILGFIADWDDLHHVSMLNESRNKFLPVDNPFLPGEMPIYLSWLGNLLPSFLIKCLGIDQIHAYYIWSPLFFHLAFVSFIHYLIKQFSKNEWVPFFSVGFFFLTQKLVLKVIQLRDLAGIFLVFSTLIFIIKYFSTKRKTYLVLSFSWSFLYIVKGNYLPAIIPGIAVFYFQALFQRNFPKLNIKVLRLLILCSILPLFLFWFSKAYFTTLYLPDLFIFNFPRIMERGINALIPVAPILLVYILYFYKRFKKKETLSSLEFTLLCGLTGILFFSSLAGKHLEGKAHYLIFLGLITSFPVVAKEFIPKPAVYRGIGGLFLVLFAILTIKHPTPIENTGYIEMTKDEIEAIKFIRNKTPEDSIILYNIARYNDRPAIMSSLTYRKSFIDEGERFANIYNVILQQRLYDYWDFLHCNCTEADREYFFAKYPKLNYIVEYNASFQKHINPLKGLPSIVFPISITIKDPKLFIEVFRNNDITIYKIKRRPL